MAEEPAATSLIEAILADVFAVIGDMAFKITNAFTAVFNPIVNSINNIVGLIADGLVLLFDGIFEAINDMIGFLVEEFSALIETAITFIGDLTRDIIAVLEGFVSDALSFIQGVFDDAIQGILDVVGDVTTFLVDLFDSVLLELQTIIDAVIDFFTDLFTTVRDGISDIIGQAFTVVESITDAVTTFVTEVVDVVGNSLRDLLETIANLPDAISDLAEQLIQSAKVNIADPLTNLPVQMINDIVEAASGAPSTQSDKMQLDMLNLVFGTSPVIQSPETMREAIAKFMPENPIMKSLITLLVSPFILIQLMSGIAQANSQIVLQEHALVNPYRLMEPADIVRARNFALIETPLATEWIRKWGYTESAADMILQIGKNVPPAGELVSWWHRQIIDTPEFESGLKKLAWTSTDIAHLKQAAFILPPIQDLITMSVREVFTPEIAEQFGQFEDFPQEFVRQAAKQGLTEQWAKNYWGAHWALPSMQMGFQMLHRKVISTIELQLLMRASDVMPFWRDKLEQISFSPLTRVDIRRMHKVGVLSEQDVNTAYHDIGYNDINAQRLTEFTLAINTASDDTDDEGLGSLTRNNIIAFFKDGIFSGQESIDLLTASGMSLEVAELFVRNAEMEVELEFRRESISLIIEKAKSGTISFDQAQDALNRLELEELEKQKALNTLARLSAQKNKLPTKSDLDKFLGAGIIDSESYLANLQLLGYNSLWANRYLQLKQGGRNGGQEQG